MFKSNGVGRFAYPPYTCLTLIQNNQMLKIFRWNEDKNKQLQQERGISFEEVISHIEQGGLLDILEHPNRDKYQNQQIYVISINQSIYLSCPLHR